MLLVFFTLIVFMLINANARSTEGCNGDVDTCI